MNLKSPFKVWNKLLLQIEIAQAHIGHWRTKNDLQLFKRIAQVRQLSQGNIVNQFTVDKLDTFDILTTIWQMNKF